MPITPDEPLTLLGGLTAREFLRDYWQKRPLLVRQAMPGFESPLPPEELAGMACEESVISRLVLEHGEAGAWHLRHGPFDEEDFTTLPDSHWTLLVSDLEKHLPQLRDYLEPFRFLPDWRMDDLMVSYAAPEGSVGPHVDAYDVFLLQAHGQRRWQISSAAVGAENFLPDIDLRILKDFTPEQEWVLEPGDMLYLPPGIAHHGVALSPCMTWSVGFRAPAWRDLMAAWADARYEALDPHSRYGDGDLPAQDDPGKITPAALTRLATGLREAMDSDDAALQVWFGRHLTEPKAELLEHLPLPESLSEAEAHALLDGARPLERHGAARLAWMDTDSGLHLFVNGQAHALDNEAVELVRQLCGNHTYDARTLSHLAMGIDGARDLLLELCRAGVLVEIPED
jgi:50S ribosomal protein L16 3-hydroxylase